MFRISGISGKISEDEDEAEEEEKEDIAPGMDAAKKALIEGLGKERRDRVLAAIYIVRQDAVGVVRHAAVGVWKALVSNTPRTAREILPVLSKLLHLSRDSLALAHSASSYSANPRSHPRQSRIGSTRGKVSLFPISPLKQSSPFC